MYTRKNLTIPVVIFLCLLACVAIQYWGYEYPYLGIDDANIYFVYMKNVAEGHGFVWNVGGEKVEGFTSFLWTVIGAAVYNITPTYFARVLMLILFVLTYFTIYQVLVFVRRINGKEGKLVASDVIILSLLLFPLGFVDWNILTLMETGLWTFLLTSAILEICRYIMRWQPFPMFRFSLLLIAMVLTRPESIAYNFLLVASLFIIVTMEKGWLNGFKKAIVPLVVYLSAVAGLTLWRIYYFGFPFPNTYYAKVSASIKYNITSSANYLLLFFYNYPVNVFIIVILTFFTIAILLKLRNGDSMQIAAEEKVHLMLFSFLTFGLLLPLLTGGDHFKYNRFYQPLLPIMVVAVCNYFCWKRYIGVSFSPDKKAIPILVSAFAFMMILSSKYSIPDFTASRNRVLHRPVIQDFIVSSSGRYVAEKVNETFEDTGSYPSVGTLATGGFGFIYKGKTIDLLGLNNVAMAHADPNKRGYRNHASFDKKVFYSQMPDMMGTFYGAAVVEDTAMFMLPENAATFRTNTDNMEYFVYKNIYDDIEFINTYHPALIKNKKKDFFIFDYFSNNYLKKIDSTKFTMVLLQRKFKPK